MRTLLISDPSPSSSALAAWRALFTASAPWAAGERGKGWESGSISEYAVIIERDEARNCEEKDAASLDASPANFPTTDEKEDATEVEAFEDKALFSVGFACSCDAATAVARVGVPSPRGRFCTRDFPREAAAVAAIVVTDAARDGFITDAMATKSPSFSIENEEEENSVPPASLGGTLEGAEEGGAKGDRKRGESALAPGSCEEERGDRTLSSVCEIGTGGGFFQKPHGVPEAWEKRPVGGGETRHWI